MNRFYDSKELFGFCETLNVYKLKLLNTAIFMHKIKIQDCPAITP